MDDFYLNLLSWSCLNVLAVALEANSYIWNADTGEVVHLGEAPEGNYISALDFSNDGQFLGVGISSGEVELWDIETQTKLRTMVGHSSQVACLSWNKHILSSGCADGSIWHHDVRISEHKVGELLGHQGEVCGLKWREDGELLASGGNDNVVNVWDGRIGDVVPGSRSAARWTKRNHTAAVKVYLIERTRRLQVLITDDHRPLLGALGNPPYSHPEEVRTMPQCTSGIPPQARGCTHL